MMKKCAENAEQTCKSYPDCYGCNAYRNPTNYDRTRHMSIDEMAKDICENAHNECNYCVYRQGWKCTSSFTNCESGIKQWLESEEEK